jgi:hypothetical protein
MNIRDFSGIANGPQHCYLDYQAAPVRKRNRYCRCASRSDQAESPQTLLSAEPALGVDQRRRVARLEREIADQRLKIRPNCLARADPRDIRPIVDISQRYGIPIEVVAFVGSSPIRFYAEGWTLDRTRPASSEWSSNRACG